MIRGIITTVILLISLFSKGQTQTEFCEIFTNNVRIGNINFKKSYVEQKNNCFIQAMYLEELALDSSNNYFTMEEESKDPEYIEALAKFTLESYRTNGVSNALIKNDFSNFKIILIYKDDSKLKSSDYNIKTGNKIIKLQKKKEKFEINLNEIEKKKLIEDINEKYFIERSKYWSKNEYYLKNAITNFNGKKEFWEISEIDNGKRIIEIQSFDGNNLDKEVYFEQYGELSYAKISFNYYSHPHLNSYQALNPFEKFHTYKGKIIKHDGIGHGISGNDDWYPEIIFEMYKKRLKELSKIGK
jgi:hypothetical protein